MARKAMILAIVVATATYVVAGGGLSQNWNSAPGGSAEASATLAPDFELKDLTGKAVRLSAYRGKLVVLNFWATWCSPCRQEIPGFIDLQQKYAAEGLRVLGVAMDDPESDAVPKFARKLRINYPVLLDDNDVGREYVGIGPLPLTLVIGHDGRILKRISGLTSPEEMEKISQEVLHPSSGR